MNWHPIASFYCINLDKNPQRWDNCVPEFIKVQIPYVEQVIVKESEENRFISFNHSHYDLIQKGFDTGQPFCIFEDDILFDKLFFHAEDALNQLPENWDLLYLGCNFIGDWQLPVRVSTNLIRVYNAWQSHAIVYSNKAARWILDNFDPDTFPVYDEWLRINMMPGHNVFCVSPMVCDQRPGYSDVWQRQVEYGCHRQGNDWIKNNL